MVCGRACVANRQKETKVTTLHAFTKTKSAGESAHLQRRKSKAPPLQKPTARGPPVLRTHMGGLAWALSIRRSHLRVGRLVGCDVLGHYPCGRRDRP